MLKTVTEFSIVATPENINDFMTAKLITHKQTFYSLKIGLSKMNVIVCI